jgi:hypothetical protein
MKKVFLALFVAALVSSVAVSCKSKEKCDAYRSAAPKAKTQNNF